MIGTDGSAADILGIEVTPTVVRAVRLKRDDRKIRKAAECPVLTIGDAVALDPAAIGPAVDEVMYQLSVDDRTEHLAAVTIGPRRAGVGSGPALPNWLERRARQLGQNMVSAGKLGIAFCPQRALDTAIMICEQANITVSRIDFAPVAAARTLKPGVDTITLGSGRGWRARLRDDEVLEALESAEVPVDDPLMIVTVDGGFEPVDSLSGVGLASDAKSVFGKNPARFAPAVGAALGIVDGSSGNLLDGDIIRGQQVPAAFTSEVGGIDTGEIAGSRTTVSLTRAQTESDPRAVIRQTGMTVDAPGHDESDAEGTVDAEAVVDADTEVEAVVDVDTVVDAEAVVDADTVVDAEAVVDVVNAEADGDVVADPAIVSDDAHVGSEDGESDGDIEAEAEIESGDDVIEQLDGADLLEVDPAEPAYVEDVDGDSDGEIVEQRDGAESDVVVDAIVDDAAPSEEADLNLVLGLDGLDEMTADSKPADAAADENPTVAEPAGESVFELDVIDDAPESVEMSGPGLLFNSEDVSSADVPPGVDDVDDGEPVVLFDESVNEERSVLGGDFEEPRLMGSYELSTPVGVSDFDRAADGEERAILGFGYESEIMDHAGQVVHPDDPINSFSPEPGAESVLDGGGNGRTLALVVAALILFSLAIAVGILVTQG